MQKTDPLKGLTSFEARERLKKDGYNELPSSKPRSIFRTIISILKEPMLLLLLLCGTLYLLLGDFGEGLMLMASMLIVIAISFFQERKAEHALDALRDLTSPRALVIRNGAETRIPGKEVVQGDIVILQEGDRIPADAIVTSEVNLLVDESLLTGESAPVTKSAAGFSSVNMLQTEAGTRVLSGTLVVRGHGRAQVTATGTQTEIGRIGKMLREVADEPSQLELTTRRIVKTFFIVGSAVCILLIILYGLTRNNWLDGVLYGLSLAMAVMPEEFAVVLTLFMTLGAWRLSKNNVLTRKSSSIETLGTVTVLCTDKTGTLTENKMQLRKVIVDNREIELQDDLATHNSDKEFCQLIVLAAMAGQEHPFDPMEKAIRMVYDSCGLQQQDQSLKLLREYPLAPKLFAMTRVYDSANGFIVAAKGAPEAIAELCHMSADEVEALNKRVQELADQGLRVLGVAQARHEGNALPEQQTEFKFSFAGLLAMQDPLRKTIREDLKSCYKAGIRVIMITGDYPGTAQHIAVQMGLKNSSEVITGADLEKMDELELRARIKTVNIFARVVPDQKLRLVTALKESGEIIAMTGDGVNDAPALRAAHIGIAMGQRGTDVAREAADLVLLDDDFSSVITAVRLGRRIYDNIRKAMTFILAVHVPVVGLTLIPMLIPYFPVVLFPLHIAFLELIIDPASTLIFEAEADEKNIMNRPPASPRDPAFGLKRIAEGLLLGCSVLVITLAVLFISEKLGRPNDEARALTFTTLVVANLGLIYVNRSRSASFLELMRQRNPTVKWIAGGALALMTCFLYVPLLRKLFHFDVLHFDDLLICAGVAVLGVAWFEILKKMRRKKTSIPMIDEDHPSLRR